MTSSRARASVLTCASGAADSRMRTRKAKSVEMSNLIRCPDIGIDYTRLLVFNKWYF